MNGQGVSGPICSGMSNGEGHGSRGVGHGKEDGVKVRWRIGKT